MHRTVCISLIAMLFSLAMAYGPESKAAVQSDTAASGNIVARNWLLVDDFDRPDAHYHGNAWETLTPGYWSLQDGSLRRRLKNVGNRNPITNFPWHWSNYGRKIEPYVRKRAPNLPMGMIWRRDWKMTGNYCWRGTFTIKDLAPEGRGESTGYLGLCFGGKSLYESRHFASKTASWMALWYRDGRYGVFDHRNGKPVSKTSHAKDFSLKIGDQVVIETHVHGDDDKIANVTMVLRHGGQEKSITVEGVPRDQQTDGYLGLVCYGALDFQVDQVDILVTDPKPVEVNLNELHICYPLGDTLIQKEGLWRCKFVALFRSPGEDVEIRVSDSPEPRGGWKNVPSAGKAKIVDNDWRRYTAIVPVTLPVSPATKSLYYTVWKDGVDVTADPRPALSSQGYLGKKKYVGRLPQLTAPYRVCTLGGHALHHNGTTLSNSGTYQENWIHGQPTVDAYKHFEDYRFQVINWDDDIWYLELLFPPPSTDDAYKIITLSIANPTTRWKMMRHWNILNPGDHDYGMDDIKGPEQILVRQRDDLGQDSEYMRRNFDINHHLTQGLERQIGATNPKDWRCWKMPNGDFSIIVLESRNWRTSQETNLWREGGWGHVTSLNDRRNPTRTLLGEEQFAWLQQKLCTETSPLICITGVNCMHPIFTGRQHPKTKEYFSNTDRVAADYAGWCTAGTSRLLQLLGSRPGILSVYGDIHLACAVENLHHRVIESSCGPIGRGGSRGLKTGWGPLMEDYDGRKVRVHAMYHLLYDSPSLRKRTGPPHWNFLEKQFDPRGKTPTISMKIRNIIDPPDAKPRGGGVIDRVAQTTGRLPSCSLPEFKTLPNADVHFRLLDGRTIQGTRSLADGTIALAGLIDVQPGTKVMMTATTGDEVKAKMITTVPYAYEP